MTQQEIINTIADDIGTNAYRARIHRELAQLGHEEDEMYCSAYTEMGKASGCLECLIYLTGEYHHTIYKVACERAEYDIASAKGDIVRLLALADYESKDYHQLINDQ